jgi:hypothetical protein
MPRGSNPGPQALCLSRGKPDPGSGRFGIIRDVAEKIERYKPQSEWSTDKIAANRLDEACEYTLRPGLCRDEAQWAKRTLEFDSSKHLNGLTRANVSRAEVSVHGSTATATIRPANRIADVERLRKVDGQWRIDEGIARRPQ